MTSETSHDLTGAEAALVSAALKLSLLAREEEEEAPSRDRRLAAGNSNSNSAQRPPNEESAGVVAGKRKTRALALLRWQIQLTFGNLVCILQVV